MHLNLSQFCSSLKARLKVMEVVQGSTWLQKKSGTENSKSGGKPSSGAGLVATETKTRSKNGNGNNSGKAGGFVKKETYCHFCQIKNSHRSFECKTYPSWEARTAKLGNGKCHIFTH